MKIFVSDYTQTRINDIIEEACVRAWNEGFDYTENREVMKQRAEGITREIIGVISAFPERVVEL